MTRNLGTLQVLRMIEDPHFDVHAQASRSYSGGFVPLVQHAPFTNAMRSRMSKEKADRKTAGMRGMYEKIAQEEKDRLRFRWVHRLMASVSGWLGLLVWLAILAGVGVGLYFLILLLMHWGGAQARQLVGRVRSAPAQMAGGRQADYNSPQESLGVSAARAAV